ncbi:peptidase S9 [Bacteroidia bacterium]|nr:peptidase S9 [Bacteroidia bacterium]
MKRIIIYLLAISSCLVVFSQKQLTLEDIWIKKYFNSVGDYSNYVFAENSDYFYKIKKSNIITKNSISTGNEISVLLDLKTFRPQCDVLDIDKFEINFDETKIIVATNTTMIYRHSSKSSFYYFDMQKNVCIPIENGQKISLATLSPDGKKIAYIKDNNLFYWDIEKEKTIQITTDGKLNSIINGKSDWVYEEEFQLTKAFYWSNKSDYIFFLKFDESNVKEAFLVKWGQLYPEASYYKYPKAGEDNSSLDLCVYSLNTKNTETIFSTNDTIEYIPKIVNSHIGNTFAFVCLNRLQNYMQIFHYNIEKKHLHHVYSEKSFTYINLPELYFSNDDSHFAFTSDIKDFNQIYIMDIYGKDIRLITTGQYDVSKIYGLDLIQNILFFQAAYASPITRDIFSANLNKNEAPKKISNDIGCNDAFFMPKFNYFIKDFSTSNTPDIYSLCDKNGNVIKILENNKIVANRLQQYNFVDKEFGNIPYMEDSLSYCILKPKVLEPGKKYPLIIYVYGGPGAQIVEDKFDKTQYTAWFQYLVNKGYIIAYIDPRGSGYKGSKFQKQTYLNLGDFESTDVVTAKRYFDSFSYIDASRTAIFGWSYGGYLSALCMTRYPNVFKCGISVAPVLNWRYYDNVYTERYLGLPSQNAYGYDAFSPTNLANQLEGKLLLVHSTSDDNVHLSNSMDFITALNNAEKQYDLAIYPGKNHSITGTKTRMHLFKKITMFLDENL